MGGMNAMLTTIFAYVADITTLKQRSMRIVIIDVSIGTGTAVAQLIIGVLVTKIGYFYPYIIILGILIVILAYTLFLLPETVVADTSAPLCELNHFKSITKLFKGDQTNRRRQLILGLVLLTLISLSQYNINNRLTLYLTDAPLCWNPKYVGYFLFYAILIRQFGTLVSTKMLRNHVGDSGLAIAGIMSAIGFDVVMAGAVHTAVVFTGRQWSNPWCPFAGPLCDNTFIYMYAF